MLGGVFVSWEGMTHKLTKKEWFAGNCSRLQLSKAHPAQENAVLFWKAFYLGRTIRPENKMFGWAIALTRNDGSFWKAGDGNSVRNLIVVYFELTSSCFLFGKWYPYFSFRSCLQVFPSNVYYQELFCDGWVPQIKDGKITLPSVKPLGGLAKVNKINQKANMSCVNSSFR